MKKTRGKPDKRKNFKIFLTASLVAVALIAVVLSVLFLGTGATANTATSSRSLTPIGYPVGSASASALVVYDPGSTGAAKGIADDIASNLQAQGYFVSLAGIARVQWRHLTRVNIRSWWSAASLTLERHQVRFNLT